MILDQIKYINQMHFQSTVTHLHLHFVLNPQTNWSACHKLQRENQTQFHSTMKWVLVLSCPLTYWSLNDWKDQNSLGFCFYKYIHVEMRCLNGGQYNSYSVLQRCETPGCQCYKTVLWIKVTIRRLHFFSFRSTTPEDKWLYNPSSFKVQLITPQLKGICTREETHTQPYSALPWPFLWFMSVL